jgi:O-antigen ligase
MMLTLLLSSAGIVWVLGGNRLWIMMPALLAIFAAGGVWAWRFFGSSYRFDFVIPPGGWMGLVFLVYLAVMIPLAEVPFEAGQQWFRFAGYTLVFWMWVNLLRFQHRWRWVLIVLMVSVSLMAWYAIYQEVQGTRMAVFAERHDDYGMRASGAYICPNHFAHLLHMVMLAGLGIVFAPGAGVSTKLFAGYAFLLGLYPLFLSLSRSGWIGIMVGTVVFVLAMALRRSWKKFLLMLIVAPLLVGAAGLAVWKVSPKVQMRVTQAIQGDVRIPLWKDSLKITLDAPWFGHGLGSYRHMYPAYHEHMVANRDPEFAHNDYLHFWGEIGIVGMLLIGAALIAVVWRALRVLLRTREPHNAALMAGLLAMMAGTAAHTFFDFNFHIFGNVQVYLLLVAALLAATPEPGVDRVIAVVAPRFRWVGVALLAALVVIMGLYTRYTASYFHEAAGKRAAEVSELGRAHEHFQAALAWAPSNWRAHLAAGHLRRVEAMTGTVDETRRRDLIGEGVHHFQQALAGNPWSADAMYGMGTMERLQGNQEAALVWYQTAVDKAVRYAHYRYALADQLRNMGRLEEAIAEYQAAMKLDPTPLGRINIRLLQRRLSALQSGT